MRIIVNADDLGINEAVNDAIFDGLRVGTITSSTLLANGPAIKAATQNLHFFPMCSFGVHLNLTEFEPLWPESRSTLAAILNQEGHFNGNTIREVHIGRRMLGAIFREWCCQIENLIALGVEPSHFDAHHHVHTIPQMLPVLRALRRRYKVKRIRISRNMYEDWERPGRSLLAKKRAYNFALRAIGFRTTRVFTDLTTFVRLCAAEPPGSDTAELMTHPGSLPRNEEADLLESGWMGKFSYGVMPVSYKDL